MFTMYQDLIVTDFDMLPIDASKFDKLDLDFYNSVGSNLIRNQFRLIGDFEESNFKKRNPAILFFSRLMMSDDDTTKATIYHLKMGELNLKITEFLTEFTNGAVLISSNDFLSSKIEYPNEIEYSYCNTESTDDLLRHHKDVLKKLLAINNIDIRKIKNADEIIEQRKRIKRKENQFRESIKKEDIIKELRKFFVGIKNEQLLLKIADRIMELKMATDK